jgi:hypothetical protein
MFTWRRRRDNWSKDGRSPPSSEDARHAALDRVSRVGNEGEGVPQHGEELENDKDEAQSFVLPLKKKERGKI